MFEPTDTNKKMASASLSFSGPDLISCALGGDVKKLDDVVRSGIKVDYSTQKGTSVLHAAAFIGDKDMMLHLLNNYPLCIEKGKMLDRQHGFNAMHHWCFNTGDSEIFDLLMRSGFDCEKKTSDGQTSLDLAKKKNNEALVKHIESVLNGPSVDYSSSWTALHECALNGDALKCILLNENNNSADTMTLATCPTAICDKGGKVITRPITPLEVAVYSNNMRVLDALTMYTDYPIIQKCLETSISKEAKQCLLKGIRKKLRKEYTTEDGHVAFGKIYGEERPETVCVVYSTTKTHGAETRKAGYRILFRNPEICEKDGRDEGREVLHYCHKHKYVLSEADKTGIHKAIDKCYTLWDKHSNIRGIASSPVKYSKGKFLKKPCVVILCLFKSFIPEEELPFPEVIDVDGVKVPVDVREGFFKLVGCDNPLARHVPLRMGCNIGTNDKTSRFGTIGPFVVVEEELGFLTCAHVMFSKQECLKKAGDSEYSESTGRLALQPGSSSSNESFERDLECGRVSAWAYEIERKTSIDIAVVKVTKPERIPQSGRFTVYDVQQLQRIVYEGEELTFDTGRVGKPIYVEEEQAQAVPGSTGDRKPKLDGNGDHGNGDHVNGDHGNGNNTLLFGSSSGPTIGKYTNSAKVQFTAKKCGKAEAQEIYRGMYYINNNQCHDNHCKLPPLVVAGDSGAGVYQQIDTSLVCIGVLVAVDNTDSAVVIPIEPILEHFKIKLKDFTVPQSH